MHVSEEFRCAWPNISPRASCGSELSRNCVMSLSRVSHKEEVTKLVATNKQIHTKHEKRDINPKYHPSDISRNHSYIRFRGVLCMFRSSFDARGLIFPLEHPAGVRCSVFCVIPIFLVYTSYKEDDKLQ